MHDRSKSFVLIASLRTADHPTEDYYPFLVLIIPNFGLNRARFEESRIKTKRTGDASAFAVEKRDGREAPASKLAGTGWGGQHADDGKMRQGGGDQPPLATAAITLYSAVELAG